MLIILKFPKSIAGRTKGPREPHAAPGPRVCDPVIEATVFSQVHEIYFEEEENWDVFKVMIVEMKL